MAWIFKNHIKKVCNKISKSIGIIYSVSKYLPLSILLSRYYTQVYPYLTYCIIVWSSTSTTYLHPLVTLQKRCIHLVTRSSYLAHTSILFKQHKVLKLKDIYVVNCALFAFKNRDRWLWTLGDIIPIRPVFQIAFCLIFRG